jgi:hypothetical protein
MEVGGEMVQVELFWGVGASESSQLEGPRGLHVCFSGPHAERQTACNSTEEPASFSMHAI